MVKEKSLKQKLADDEALKKKLLESMRANMQDSDDEMSTDEEEELGLQVETDSDDEEEVDGEAASGDEEGDEVAVSDEDEAGDGENASDDDEEDGNEVEYEESDEDEGAVDKSVYEDSEDENENQEESENEEIEEPIKSKKSNEPAAKKAKLEVPEPEEEDDDEEVTEEPIKREADIEDKPEKPLKRKRDRTQKEQKTENVDPLKVEELPLTFFILNVPRGGTKTLLHASLTKQIQFKRIFYVGDKLDKQPPKFFIVFNNQDEADKARDLELTITNPISPDLTPKKVQIIPAKWTNFETLAGHTVCVKGLKNTVTEKDLKSSFEEFGEVLKIELVTQMKGAAMKFPFAYIFFKDVESAGKACEAGKVSVGDVKADVQAYQVKNKTFEATEDKSFKLEKQGRPISMAECPRTLSIGNATKFTTHKEIEGLCSRFGEIDRVLSQAQTAQGNAVSKVFFVVFKDEDGYNAALKYKKNFKIAKRSLQKGPVRWNVLQALQPFMVKVGGISSKATKEEVEDKFKSFGKVANIELFKPKNRTNSVAFVFFESAVSAKKALSLDGSEFQDQILSVHQRRGNSNAPGNTIFIKKSEKITKSAVEAKLKKFGKIKKIHDGLKNFAVAFVSANDAAKVLSKKTIEIEGEEIELRGNSAAEYKTNTNTNAGSGVLVTGLSNDSTIEQVVEHFKECGDVVKSYIGNTKKKSGARNNFAFLEFENLQGKSKALKLSKSVLNGKAIFVKHSKSRA